MVRIRSILASSKGRRFVHKILAHEERSHPKIQRFLGSQDASAGTSKGTPSSCVNHATELMQQETLSAKKGLTSHDLQAAAAFMAGRYAFSC